MDASNGQNASRTFAVGEVVCERFRIICLLGEGGMGEVYEAEDLELPGERVAVKAVRASLAADERALKHLIDELQLARRISSPHVCRVHDVFRHHPAPGARIVFFTMELLKGD